MRKGVKQMILFLILSMYQLLSKQQLNLRAIFPGKCLIRHFFLIKTNPTGSLKHHVRVYVSFCLVFISASVPLPDERNDTLELENQRRLIKTLETITNRLKRTLNKEPMYSFQLASEMLIADSNSLETEKAFLFCRPGSVLRGRMCGKAFSHNQR